VTNIFTIVTISMLNNFLTIGFSHLEQNIVFPEYSKSFQRKMEMYSYLTLVNLVYVLIIKAVIFINDCFNTCNIVHVRDWTMTFISMSKVYFQRSSFHNLFCLVHLYVYNSVCFYFKPYFIIT
jgi:hypothetical protein